jgi:hypothetical protein
MFLLFTRTSCWFMLYEHKSVQYEIHLPFRVTYIAVSRSRNNEQNNVQNNPQTKRLFTHQRRQLLGIIATDVYSGGSGSHLSRDINYLRFFLALISS